MTAIDHSRPFRFGYQTRGPLTDKSWLDTARMIEDMGFSSLLMPDHFTDQWGPISALTAAATVTTDLIVGALVFGNDYRHPTILAKEMATLDQISEGRLEFGIGAGWMRTDYDEVGMAYDRPGLRIERLEESIEIIRGCWSGEEFSFEGQHYTITNYQGLPAPHTPGGPPILIGGGGPRMLGVAARHANIVGLTANLRAGAVGPEAVSDSMPDAFDTKLARVTEAAAENASIELSSLTMATVVTNDRQATLDGMAELFGADVEQVAESPMVLAGTVEEITESLIERRERWGFNYVVVQYPDGDTAAVQAFAPVIEALNGM